jgi:hypothetical protein
MIYRKERQREVTKRKRKAKMERTGKGKLKEEENRKGNKDCGKDYFKKEMGTV